MYLFRHYIDLPNTMQGSVVALGNFDGVHSGHRVVIRTAQTIGKTISCPIGVMTFEPHPRAIFVKNTDPFRLTPFRSKVRVIATLGIDFMIAQRFDLAFSHYTANEFVHRVLVHGIAVRHVVVGYDYLFGKGRGGDTTVLETLGQHYGFAVTVVPPVRSISGEICSSTRVRICLMEGRPRDATLLLGRYFEVEGWVKHGLHKRRYLGYPTANLYLGEYQRLKTGVYAVCVSSCKDSKTQWRNGIALYGEYYSPQSQGSLFEVHLLDFSDDLYHCRLRVALVAFLRPGYDFDSLCSLQEQVIQDINQAKDILGSFLCHAP